MEQLGSYTGDRKSTRAVPLPATEPKQNKKAAASEAAVDLRFPGKKADGEFEEIRCAMLAFEGRAKVGEEDVGVKVVGREAKRGCSETSIRIQQHPTRPCSATI
jgi:Mg-chelatase subunit ChlI